MDYYEIASMKSGLCILFGLTCCLLAHSLLSQAIWTESFTYADGTTTGGNLNTDNPAADWTSTCAVCTTATDWFKVVSGKMDGRDTNGPAILTTEIIDISAYPGGVQFSVDLSGTGPLESCNAGCGCNCIDWIRIEYSINGGSFADASAASGGACGNSCAGNTYVTIGTFTAFTFTQCPITGNTLQLRISVQNWATDEHLSLDNISVDSANCGPLALIGILQVENTPEEIQISFFPYEYHWAGTYSLERSDDGLQFSGSSHLPDVLGNSILFHDYAHSGMTHYYRILFTDEDGFQHRSETRQANSGGTEFNIFYDYDCDCIVLNSSEAKLTSWELFDMLGRSISSGERPDDNSEIPVPFVEGGIYIFAGNRAGSTTSRIILLPR